MESSEVTRLLELVSSGDQRAQEQLIEQVYGELRRLAGSLMRNERSGHTLQPTALVNEAWFSIAGSLPNFENRAHFFGAAAQAMRRILVDHARKKKTQKRGSGAQHVTFQDIGVASFDPGFDILDLDRAIGALGQVDPRLVQVVELRCFTGCALDEIAAITGVSLATVKRDWAYARAWLYDYLSGSSKAAPAG